MHQSANMVLNQITDELNLFLLIFKFLFMKVLFSIKSILLMCVMLVILCSCNTTTYYLVRHGEKLNNSDTSSLSGDGWDRAYALRDTLLNDEINYIFVSDKKRTQQTATPLATAISKNFEIFSLTNAGTQSLITRLKSYNGQSRILVVGHTSTIPKIIDSLMKSPQHVVIPEDSFNRMYVVRIIHQNPVRRTLTVLRYGRR